VTNGTTTTEQGVLSGDGGLTKEGGGELVLNGSTNNTYTGATVVNAGSLVLSNSGGNAIHSSSGITVNIGGTLVLGADNQIGDGIGLTLNGGTFLVGALNITEKLGTLTLSASSTIDFGDFGNNGLRQVTFDDSSLIAWTGTLTITNWQGVARTSSEFTRLVFGVDGLNTNQLGQIVFASQGINGGELIGGGELAPIPEAPVVWGAAALAAFIFWRERRRARSFFGAILSKAAQGRDGT
ncbi:MAG: autotransporter-associated beta strand repeat-containing protein, partial [Chthoniobacterales bacterium]